MTEWIISGAIVIGAWWFGSAANSKQYGGQSHNPKRPAGSVINSNRLKNIPEHHDPRAGGLPNDKD